MRILVTAGPTREYFDTVRFISNPSSGKMGYAIAVEASQRRHQVVLVSGPVELPDPGGVELIRVVSAREMFEAAVLEFAKCQCAVMTAAVCDYRPSERLDRKLKKDNRSLSLSLEPTEDILAYLGTIKGNRALVGFAMEDHDHRANAEAKLQRKHCDAIVLNGLGNVGGDSAEVEIFRADTGWSPAIAGKKAAIAAAVVDLAEALAARPGAP
jgi:phosphopantothenoylcysteine decarboxylase/phosphopantothenate--cysteine ligase